MRAFEALLLLAILLNFVVLAIRPPSLMRWMRGLPLVTVAMVIVQSLLEGPRWQMAPAYALAAVLALLSMRACEASAGVSTGWTGARRIAVGPGAMGLAVAVALPIVVPVFRFPHPTGPHAVGTLTYHWTDAARAEVFGTHPQGPRQLMVQVWYPAMAGQSHPRAAYMADADAVTSAFARLHGIPAFLFGHFRYVTTNAVAAAPMADDQANYPVLLFLEGATGFRQMNTYQAEELVSHGYVVAALDQPGAAAAVVFPDGHQTLGLNLAQLQSAIRPSYLPERQGSAQHGVVLPSGGSLKERSIVPYLAQDALFVLDQLAAVNRSDPHGILTGKLDTQRVGAFGISLGGIVVGDACHLDPRIRACLVMDAPMSSDVVKAGLRQPGLWITRDAANMRLERQRAGGWPEAEIEAHQSSMRAVYDSLSGAGYFVQISGLFHSNFSDVPMWTPLAAQSGLAGPIDGSRAHEIVNAYSRAFFDRHLKGQAAALLDGPVARYPEASIESRRP